MIITIFSEDDSAKRSMLAINLAALCAHNHRKTLLVDATSPKYALGWSARRNPADPRLKPAVRDIKLLGGELENPQSYFRTHYQDIIIDVDGVAPWYADEAMIASDVLVVPIRFYQGDLRTPKNLAQRIENLRLCNPALRVLVVDVMTLNAFSDAEQLAFDVIRSFARKISGAVIADVVIQERAEDRRILDRGLSLFEANPYDQRAVGEIKALYQEILTLKDARMRGAEIGNAILHAIQRWTHEKADGAR